MPGDKHYVEQAARDGMILSQKSVCYFVPTILVRKGNPKNISEIYDVYDGEFKGWYCNVGYPAVLEKDMVSYIDLALDLWVSKDGTQTVLDEDVFLELPINATTRTQAVAALEELKEKFSNEKPPA